jgi:hypothetical protein
MDENTIRLREWIGHPGRREADFAKLISSIEGAGPPGRS